MLESLGHPTEEGADILYLKCYMLHIVYDILHYYTLQKHMLYITYATLCII